MPYSDLIVLIPSHSLEDFPSDLPEGEAASLLNSFVVLWHPALLADAGVLPRWHRADDPPEVCEKRLIMLPTKCNATVPAGWVERARREGAVVVADISDREPMLAAALAPLEREVTVDPDLAADFLALGFCYLQIELLTRHMRHYSNLDEVHLQREALAAAQAALAGDESTARTHLRICFEVLTEAREKFYPVDCYLIDLCLLIPRLADAHLAKTLLHMKPLSVLVTGQDLEEIARESPASVDALREAWERGTAALVGGEYREAPTPVLPLESVLWQFFAGRQAFRRVLGREPDVWGRRRYGLFPQLPQLLQKFGYQGALHLAMDDGLYPDHEYSKTRWEGTNGSVIDAVSRIPLAAEAANSFLRFPTRMAESMDHDHVAAVLFARWPEVKAPWFDDLRRMHNYSAVLGRWVTLEDFFQHTETPGRMSGYDVNDYLSPFLVHGVAYQEADPIGRFVDHYRRRATFDAAAWCHAMRSLLVGKPIADAAVVEIERTLEVAEPSAANPAAPEAGATEAGVAETERPSAETRLVEFADQAAGQLAEAVLAGSGNEPGYLLLNPLPFGRKVSVELPKLETPPSAEGPVQFVQWDASRKAVTAEIPGCGFVWLPLAAAPGGKSPKPPAVPMAEPNVLRNEFFEVYLNSETGGVGKLKAYGRTPNRLSHQLAFRFPRERKLPGQEDQFGDVKSAYSQMRMTRSDVTCAGPSLGEIVNSGEIVDQVAGKVLANYKQTFRVWRGRPFLEIRIELDIAQMPDGDPWSNYYAARFAWNDSAASLTRSVLQGAQGIKEERFESPHYFEIATESQRTTILNAGLPFHRKTGDRIVDSLLVVAGETRREFRFAVAFDQNYPLQAALDVLSPVISVATAQGPPRIGRSGWFFHLDVRNVQVTRIMDRMAEPSERVDSWDSQRDALPPPGAGCAVRLIETEGRPIRAKLRCFRAPVAARQRNFRGNTVTDLTLEGDAVLVDLTAYEIADVELTFEQAPTA